MSELFNRFPKLFLPALITLALISAACGVTSAKPDQVPPPGIELTQSAAGLPSPQANNASEPSQPATQTAPIPETGGTGTLAPTEPPAAAAQPVEDCTATQEDMLGPFYEPGAPERDQVGQGYVLTGTVRSAQDCAPIPGAQIEFWMAGPDGVYTDDYRAALFSGEDGSYAFESPIPVPYGGRPPHIHVRVSAPGYPVLISQHYPQTGQTEATFDLVLTPE